MAVAVDAVENVLVAETGTVALPDADGEDGDDVNDVNDDDDDDDDDDDEDDNNGGDELATRSQGKLATANEDEPDV